MTATHIVSPLLFYAFVFLLFYLFIFYIFCLFLPFTFDQLQIVHRFIPFQLIKKILSFQISLKLISKTNKQTHISPSRLFAKIKQRKKFEIVFFFHNFMESIWKPKWCSNYRLLHKMQFNRATRTIRTKLNNSRVYRKRMLRREEKKNYKTEHNSSIVSNQVK